MNNEKNKSITITSEASETVAGDESSRRPWHKPIVKRIDVKRTMFNLGSGADSVSVRT